MTPGYGPDFAEFRSLGVLMNMLLMMRELPEEIPEASINSDGYLVVWEFSLCIDLTNLHAVKPVFNFLQDNI